MASSGQSLASGFEQLSPIAQVLAQLMDECVGIRRNQQGLAQTVRQISTWQQMLGTTDPALRNRLEASSQIVSAALQRTQSCGAHARTDDISAEIIKPETEMM